MTIFDEFSALAMSWAHFYRMRETTYISFRQDDSWYLLYSRELLHINKSPDLPSVYIETPSIRVGQFHTKIDDSNATRIMESILAERGKVTVGSWSVSLSDTVPQRDRFDRLYPAMAPGQLRRPTYIMESGAVDLTNSKDRLNLELMACNTPFESLEELCVELMIPITLGELTQMTHAEIILGNLFRIDDASTLKDGHLNLKIAAPCEVKQDLLKISAKVFYSRNLPPKRFVIPANNFAWTEQDGKFYNECSIEMDGQLALVFISYEGEFCHKWWLRDQSKSFSPRFQLHRLFDIDNKIEKTFFESKNDFEDRIALLLCLMNLTILSYGGIPEVKDAPDILAYSDNNDLYVIECTTGDIDQKGKLQRLCDRAQDIEARARQSSLLIANLMPVVFTSLPRAHITAHLAKLQALKISVFCREDIEQLLRRMEAPPTLEEVRTTVQAFIPTGT